MPNLGLGRGPVRARAKHAPNHTGSDTRTCVFLGGRHISGMARLRPNLCGVGRIRPTSGQHGAKFRAMSIEFRPISGQICQDSTKLSQFRPSLDLVGRNFAEKAKFSQTTSTHRGVELLTHLPATGARSARKARMLMARDAGGARARACAGDARARCAMVWGGVGWVNGWVDGWGWEGWWQQYFAVPNERSRTRALQILGMPADSGRNRPNLVVSRLICAMGPKPVDSGRSRANSQWCPNWGNFGPNLPIGLASTKFRPISTDGRIRPIATRFGPGSTKFGLGSAKLCPKRPNPAKVGPESTKIGPASS